MTKIFRINKNSTFHLPSRVTSNESSSTPRSNESILLPLQDTKNEISSTLSSTLSSKEFFNINELLNDCNLSKVKNSLENKTMSLINNEKYEAISLISNFISNSFLLKSSVDKNNILPLQAATIWSSPEQSVEEKLYTFSEGFSESKMFTKMIGFQYISNINELILGRTLKMIRIQDGKFYFAGTLLNIKKKSTFLPERSVNKNVDFSTLDSGENVNIVCKVFPKGNVLNYNFNKYLVFQKLNKDEEMILSLQDYIKN